MTQRRTSGSSGLLYTLGAYILWGILPGYFIAVLPTTPVELVSWRVLLSLVFCAILLTVTRGWRGFAGIVSDRRSMLLLAAASVFIAINWLVYVYSATSGQVVEAALGYFILPLVTVVLGVVVLRERLRPLQWIAVGISAAAVVVLAVDHHGIPWLALALATSFGVYSLLKNKVGPRVDAISGLTIETAYLALPAAAVLVLLGLTTGITFGTAGPLHTVLLLSAGVVTAVPLLLFAAGARRIPLVYLGLLQYVSPVLQLIIGVLVLHEPMPLSRWIGFGIVWVALIVLTIDMFRHGTRQRAAAAAAVADAG